jgi:hypothetical protein
MTAPSGGIPSTEHLHAQQVRLRQSAPPMVFLPGATAGSEISPILVFLLILIAAPIIVLRFLLFGTHVGAEIPADTRA